MRNISITGKFAILLGAVGCFVGMETFFSSTQMQRIDANYRGVISSENAASTALARANRSMQTARAAIGDLLMSHTEVLNSTASAEFQSARDGFVKSMDAATAAMGKDTELSGLRAKGIEILDVTCKASIGQAVKAVSDADIRMSQAQFMSDCQPQFPLISKLLIEKTQLFMDRAAKVTGEVEADARSSVWQTVAVVGAGLVLFLALGLVGVRRWLVNPIRSLSATMGRLANADYAAVIGDIDRRDEIGGMARAVQVFKDNGLRTIALEQEADESRGRSEEERRRTTELDKRRASEMMQATSSLAGGLKHLSQGDLCIRLNEPFADDFESLRADFNAAVDQLASTLVAVASATLSIDAGSQEISRSSDDLSKRTEQQAASLEETAAALDEITANVANSSKRTTEAQQVASDARQGARRSSEVVTRAVQAIEKIEASSGQISNIIGVIDEIAFQTNLLALNAGVEAARAGEAGKGFAVVAQEVRELAQRSAQAAKEIKELIGTSSREVETGAALVRETGQALVGIQNDVANINQQMDSIALSSKEQSVGLTQVNTAVNDMDQVTQKNAAMVEEANAASATLAMESAKLRDLIAAFTLPGSHAKPSSAPSRYSNFSTVGPKRPARASRVGNAAVADDWQEF